jgi:hypothetical protein
VGILRRGRYVKGKQIGKSPVVDVVSLLWTTNAAA